MKRKAFFAAALLAVVLAVGFGINAQTDPWYRPLSTQGHSLGVGYGTQFPSAANIGTNPADGELFVRLTSGATANPVLWVYGNLAAAWIPISPIGTGVGSMPSTLVTNAVGVANSVWGGTNQLIFEGATANVFEAVITATDPTVANDTYTLPDRAVAAETYEFHATSINETATRDFMWPTEAPEVASLFMTTDVNEDLYCHRLYIPHPITVSGISMWLEDGGGLAAADILGVSVYADNDAAASQIMAGTGDGTAAGLETVAMAGVLQPDFYRICACTSDQTNMLFGAVAIHDADYEALNATDVPNFGIAAQVCVTGVTPTFTGAIAADDEEPFMFKIH